LSRINKQPGSFLLVYFFILFIYAHALILNELPPMIFMSLLMNKMNKNCFIIKVTVFQQKSTICLKIKILKDLEF